jgi:hypothetical protein
MGKNWYIKYREQILKNIECKKKRIEYRRRHYLKMKEKKILKNQQMKLNFINGISKLKNIVFLI